MSVELHGYQYSVYAWIARLALSEKGVAFAWTEVDPFAVEVPEAYLALQPFGRVPTLVHGSFVLYETGAITRYVDEAFAGPRLQPTAAQERARMNQIISIVDSYAYWPLVRQVFSHGVFRPRLNRASDETEFRNGLAAAPKVLLALERLAGGGSHLVGTEPSLADIHLAPMIAYFTEAPDGAALLESYPRLAEWWAAFSARRAFAETKPSLPGS